MTVGTIAGEGPARLPQMSLGQVVDVDTKFVAWVLFVFATSMGIWQFMPGSAERYAWLIADFVCACLFLRYQSQFINISLSNLVFMSWPLIACISAVWSVAPSLSLYHGIQLLMTVLVAFLFCIQYRLEQIVTVIFSAMLLAGVLSFVLALVSLVAPVLPHNVGIDYKGNWVGAFPTKNVMGDAMILLVISASCLFLQGRWRRVTGTAVLLGLFLILMTRAATPILSVFMTLAPVPFAYAWLRGRGSFLMLAGISLVTAAVILTVGYVAITYYGLDPVDAVLASVGKDRSLTGRTLLWDLASQAIEARPWLGFGFNAYWVDPPSSVVQVRMAFGQEINFFHNNFLEVAVGLGVLGPILLSLGILVAVWRSVRTAVFATEPIEIWPLLIVIQVIIQTFVQNPLIWNHQIWTFLFLAAVIARR